MASIYVTTQGDTFDSIAFWLYGDEKYMKDLIECNWDHADVLVFDSDVNLYAPDIYEDEDEEEDLPFWREDDSDDEDEDDYYEYDEDPDAEDLTDEEAISPDPDLDDEEDDA